MTDHVSVTFLGGLGDIGRNCAALETGGRIVLLDCGQMFPDETMPGIDTVLPDFSYLDDKLDRIEACIVTHGHEDHIGALARLLERASFALHGSPFTLGLVRHRLDEAGVLSNADLYPLADGERRRIGPFDCEFIPVTHSVPSGLITAIGTPQGVILHSSDFKLDASPVDGRVTDLDRIAEIAADPGIRLLLCDSTNADQPGQTASETLIGASLRSVVDGAKGRRLIVACFSSHIHRVQQIIDAALVADRTVVTLGLSMKRNVALARDLGLLDVPDDRLLDIEDAADLPPEQLCVVSTGSQGETRSALAMAAAGDSRWLDISPDDTVVLSSHPIPGNEARVARMVDDLARRGAEVLHSRHLDLHTSGHGKRDELRQLHEVAAAEWFVPVHGEYHHLVAHAHLAGEIGMSADRVVVAEDGDQLLLDDGGLTVDRGIAGGVHVLVDGSLVESDESVLDDRLLIGREGFVVVTVVVDVPRREIVAGPTVVSRGWVGEHSYAELAGEIGSAVRRDVEIAMRDDTLAEDDLTRVVRRAAGSTVNELTERRPVIMPIVHPLYAD